MNGPFRVAQASGTAASGTTATPVRIYQLTKPLTDQAVMVNLGYDQKVKIDFSAIDNEKITLVHVGEKLIIVFDNHSKRLVRIGVIPSSISIPLLVISPPLMYCVENPVEGATFACSSRSVMTLRNAVNEKRPRPSKP